MCNCSDLFDELNSLWSELTLPNTPKMREEIIRDIDEVENDLAECDCGE